MQLGPLEVGVVAAIVLCLYGTLRFAELRDALGRTGRAFQAGLRGEPRP